MFVAAYFVVMKYVFRPDVSRLMNLSDEYLSRIRSELRLNRQEGIALAALVVFMGLMILPTVLM